jgi:nucleoside-diphosphate-sugar epimerase
MARVLVSGGAGFIGSHLAQALVQRGDNVRILDNFSTGTRNNIVDFKDHAEIIEGDLRDMANVAEAVKGVETIFHQAAFVSVPESIENPLECFAINVQGTIELLEDARHAGVRKVVLASSAAVYGTGQEMPLTESMPTEILSPYALSKKFNEDLASFYTNTMGVNTVALRYFNVYGPRQSPRSAYAAAIPQFIEQMSNGKPAKIYGNGKQSRDFIYVGDVVRANLAAGGAAIAVGMAFNVCSGTETSLLDLVSVLEDLYPEAPKPEFEQPRLGDVQRSIGDPARAAKALDFRAQVSLADGLKQTVQAWQ